MGYYSPVGKNLRLIVLDKPDLIDEFELGMVDKDWL